MEPDKTILVNDKNKHTCLIPLKDIYYVMAFQHNTVLYTNKGEITSTVSFNKMEELLGTQFFKIHRSYTINRDYIRLFGPDYVELRPIFCFCLHSNQLLVNPIDNGLQVL